MKYCASHSVCGAALIIALLVLSLVSTLTVGMSQFYMITVKRHSNTYHGEQAYMFLTGAENLARHWLHTEIKEDKRDNELRDHLGETWALTIPPFEIDGGLLEIQLEDLSAKLNISGLINRDANQVGKLGAVPYNIQQRRFIRLLQTYTTSNYSISTPLLNQQQAIQLTQALVDWLDDDSRVSGTDSMEDDDYIAEYGYRAANTLPLSTTELQLLPFFRRIPGLLAQLYNDITVWPLQGDKINIHTATNNVLRSLYTGNGLAPLASEDIERLLSNNNRRTKWASKEVGGFLSLESFLQHPVWNNRVNNSYLTETSEYFLFTGKVTLGEVSRQMKSVLHRDPNTFAVKAVVRSLSTL